jgi:cytochrome c peroxidase
LRHLDTLGAGLVCAVVASCAAVSGDGESRSTSQAASDNAQAAPDNGQGIPDGGPATPDGGPSNSDKLNTLEFPNASGTLRTYTDNKKISFKKNQIKSIAFFTSFGTNGRTCLHCHTPGDAWGVSAASVTFRFTHPLDATNADCIANLAACPQDTDPAHYGSDPIFRTVDGANSPVADVSTAAARQSAYSMLLTKGLIRVGIPIPAGGEFDMPAWDDPYGYASPSELSLFRRPLPSTNLRLSPTKTNTDPTPVLNAVMWDGRETLPGHDIIFDLLDQANGATLGHAQAAQGLSTADRQAIVDFETGLHTAQAVDAHAGDLAANGGNGGPEWLAANQPFYVGINDVLTGDSQTHAPFTPNVFTIYSAWASAADQYRAQIARGQALFNTKPIAIRGVGGLNDALGVDTINGTCTTCHDAPNYGHHSVKLPIDIGLVAASRRTPDMPLYTLHNKTTGATVQVTDPGRALITGKWADIGKMKGPILRGLVGRAPYFHNGSAATLVDAVSFYDTRFGIGFSAQDKADIAAFLNTL